MTGNEPITTDELVFSSTASHESGGFTDRSCSTQQQLGPLGCLRCVRVQHASNKQPKRKEPREPAAGDETVHFPVSGLRWRGGQSSGGTQLSEPVEWVTRLDPVVGSVPIQR